MGSKDLVVHRAKAMHIHKLKAMDNKTAMAVASVVESFPGLVLVVESFLDLVSVVVVLVVALAAVVVQEVQLPQAHQLAPHRMVCKNFYGFEKNQLKISSSKF